MPVAVINRTLLNFVHIPKCGGSSIEAYLESKGKVALLQKDAAGWSRCTAQHVHREIYDSLLRSFADYSFVVVRDPMARLVSEYLYAKQFVRARTRPLRPGELLVRRAVRRAKRSMRRPPLVVHPVDMGFDAWVEAVFRAYRRDPYVNDNHIRPQVEFIDPSHTLFRFEDGFDRVYDWIDQVTNTPSGHRSLHLKRSGETVEGIRDETRALIEAFYAEDYAYLRSLSVRSAA